MIAATRFSSQTAFRVHPFHLASSIDRNVRQRLLAWALCGTLAVTAHAQLGPPGTQFWTQDSDGIGVQVEAGAGFGEALAAGDFNCDGYEDLAVGMPGEDLVGAANAGRLIVLNGGPDGITSVDNSVWGQNSPVITGTPENGEDFSAVLVAGDFNGDGCADLAVGVPDDRIGGLINAGGVNVIFGGEEGLSGDDDQYLHQNTFLVGDVAEVGDRFGTALAAGDFDGDGIDDLAVGVPGENLSGVNDAGLVHVFFGTAAGLAVFGSEILHRGNGLNGALQGGELLGSALAAGDMVFAISGDELAIGSPGRDINGVDQAGAILLVSDVDGLQFDSQWAQATEGVPGASEEFDRFGAPLATGDFNGNGFDELIVGVPGEDRNTVPIVGSIGAINTFDFINEDYALWTQDDLPPEAEGLNEQFGRTLAVGDFDADGVDDLAVAAPMEDLGPVTDTGIVHVLYGELGIGLTDQRDQVWLQTIDPNEIGDQFGFSLIAGKFAGNLGDDLAIGTPNEIVNGLSAAGAVNVIYSTNVADPTSIFADGFESGDTSSWLP